MQTANVVTFTEEILNGKLHFLWSGDYVINIFRALLYIQNLERILTFADRFFFADSIRNTVIFVTL